MNYREENAVSAPNKQNYLDGLDRVILARQAELAEKRREHCKNIFRDPESYRRELKNMLGWPLVGHNDDAPPTVRKTKLAEDGGYAIYRAEVDILEGLSMSGLYFEKLGGERLPLVLVQHGGSGTPEHVSGLEGDTTNYNRMLERVIAQGVHAFAPQLLLWNKEKYGIEYDRVNIDARLKRVGGSITALELYGLKRILDYFEVQENVSRFGMVGLSYGGFYTLMLSAIDTRIESAISCAFFNTRDAYPWSDWTWYGFAEKLDDAEIACLTYPRKLCIEIGTRDALFDVKGGIASYERLAEMSREVGCDWLEFITYDGTHEFCHDDAPIEKLAAELKRSAQL